MLVYLRWKPTATADDMTEIIRWAKRHGHELVTSLGRWTIRMKGER